MYITINDIKGEKKIDLSYSIQNFDSTVGWGLASKEITVIRMLSDNVQYQPDTETSFSNGSYFKRGKDDSKWNLGRQRINIYARRDH